MSHPSPFEEVHLVAQAEPETPRFEPVAVMLAVVSFLTVLAIGLALYLVKFQVSGDVVKAALLCVAAAVVVGFFHIRPVGSLTPTERVIRNKRANFALIGVLAAIFVLGAFATAAELNSLGDWLMLAYFAVQPFLILLLLHRGFGVENGRKRSG